MSKSDLSAVKQTAATQSRRPPEPMDPRLTDIQPGGGVVIRLEQAWGRWRRWYLKTFRRRYVERMAGLRQGEENRCPHEVLDPRDLKFHQNQGGWHWAAEDDPFTWRDRIPFAREGLAELLVFSVLFFGAAGLFGWAATWLGPGTVGSIVCGLLSATAAVFGILIVWFFRDPSREIPQGTGLVVSPADGKIVTIEEIEHDEKIGGPAVLIGIFLSIFSVHINRMPIAGRIIGLRYREGKCLNALRPESARENEQLAVFLEGSESPHRPMIVRQITGAIARRIVCRLKPGDELTAGERFGMIKLGSRTELLLPREEGLKICVRKGQAVKAGLTEIAVYESDTKRNQAE